MELFLFFMIVAVGGFWWINHALKKSAESKAVESKKDEPAPYKVEAVPAPAPVVEEAKAETVAEAAPAPKAKKPPKTKAVVTTAAKKPRARKAAKTTRRS